MSNISINLGNKQIATGNSNITNDQKNILESIKTSGDDSKFLTENLTYVGIDNDTIKLNKDTNEIYVPENYATEDDIKNLFNL